MTTLQDIEARAKKLAEHHDALDALVGELQDELTRIKRARLPAIKRRLRLVAEDKAALAELLQDGKALFAKPRTRIFHGVKLGWEKGKGAVLIADAKRTVELITRHFPEHLEELAPAKRAPSKEAIAKLLPRELTRIGCTLGNANDFLVLRFVDDEVDKLVDALLNDAVAQQTEEAAA